MTKPDKRYQWLLIGMLSANFGVVFFDRNAFSFLAPFIQPDLKLTNTQIGLIAAAFSFAWAIAGLFMGSLSDRIGRRKLILVIATIVFSTASVLSGFAQTFIMLLGARMLMGIAEGGIMPITQTLIAAEVDPDKRGLAHGITQNFGANLLANFLGPIVIIAIANAVGWRNAFWLVSVPGFIMALLIALYIREPTHLDAHDKPTFAQARGLLADRTIVVCIFLSIFLVAYLRRVQRLHAVVPGERPRHRYAEDELDHVELRPGVDRDRVHRPGTVGPAGSKAGRRRRRLAGCVHPARRLADRRAVRLALLPGLCGGSRDQWRVSAGHGDHPFRDRASRDLLRRRCH